MFDGLIALSPPTRDNPHLRDAMREAEKKILRELGYSLSLTEKDWPDSSNRRPLRDFNTWLRGVVESEETQPLLGADCFWSYVYESPRDWSLDTLVIEGHGNCLPTASSI